MIKLRGENYGNLRLGNLAGPSIDIVVLLYTSLISQPQVIGEIGRDKRRGLFVKLTPLPYKAIQILNQVVNLDLPLIYLN